MRTVWPVVIFASVSFCLAESCCGQDKPLALDASPTANVPLAEQDWSSKIAQLSVSASAEKGKDFGVAEISIADVPDDLKLWAKDTKLEVRCDDCRVWFPTRATGGSGASSLVVPGQAKVYFLFDRGFPKSVDILLNGKQLWRGIQVHEKREGTAQTVIDNWWRSFCRQSYELAPDELREINSDLLSSLGGYLGGLRPERPVKSEKSTSQLEREFERTIGMLLGFESVRLAMMTDDTKDSEGTSTSPALHQLPTSLNVAGVRLPGNVSLSSSQVPPITRLVPPDCYMVRCKSLNNYKWLRGLLLDWGGSLNDIVGGSILQSGIREKLEKQLSLSAQSLQSANAESLIEDLAIIGSDLLFDQGAGVGVLIQATKAKGPMLERLIEDQRRESGIAAQLIHLNGVPVSYLQEPGNRVRSFMLRLGDSILVTNSTNIAKSVIQAKQSNKSLGELTEFRYALEMNPNAGDSEVMFYLSDPFFRRIASAPFRVELGRRRNAAADCQRLTAAASVAKATKNPPASMGMLVEQRFLPSNFGTRCDGSVIELRNGEAFDSLRGRPGTFVPVVDVQVDKCNAHELSAYHRFSQRYRSEWQVMDPVFATLNVLPVDEVKEQLELSVHITPYARNEYLFLTQHLRSPSKSYYSIGPDELMGISTNLWHPSITYNAHLGLLDQEIDFSILAGSVVVDGEVRDDLFANDSSFAAVSPADVQGLHTLNGLVKSLQERKAIPVQEPVRLSTIDRSESNFSLLFLRSVLSPPEMLAHVGAIAFDGMLKLSASSKVSQNEKWAVYATDRKIHNRMRTDLVTQLADRPADLHAFVGDVNASRIAKYLNAHAYCASRVKSAKIASWLDLWGCGMNTDPSTFLLDVENSVQSKVVCPLSGDWLLSKTGPGSAAHWTSSAWMQPTLELVRSVPPNFKHPFLGWFQNLELQFSLNQTSLDSHVRVTYKPSGGVREAPTNQGASFGSRKDMGRAESTIAPPDVAHPNLQPTLADSPFARDNSRQLPIEKSSHAQRTEPKIGAEKPQTRASSLRSSEIGITVNPDSMIVSMIKAELPASRSSLRIGDRILAINGATAEGVQSLRNQISRAKELDGIVELLVSRQSRQVVVRISLDSQVDVDL